MFEYIDLLTNIVNNMLEILLYLFPYYMIIRDKNLILVLNGKSVFVYLEYQNKNQTA